MDTGYAHINFFPTPPGSTDITAGVANLSTGHFELMPKKVVGFGFRVDTAVAIGIGSPSFDLVLQLIARDGTTVTTAQTLRTSGAQPAGKTVYVDLRLIAGTGSPPDSASGDGRSLRVGPGQRWRLRLNTSPTGGSMSGAITPIIAVQEDGMNLRQFADENTTLLQRCTTTTSLTLIV